MYRARQTRPISVSSVEIPGSTSIFVKWFHMCNALGDVGPLVAIIAVNSMPPDQYFVKQVKFFTNVNVAGEFGWLYIAKTRGGNSELWKHFFLNVVVPTLKVNANIYDDKVRKLLAATFQLTMIVLFSG
jgi:hypothetical protein